MASNQAQLMFTNVGKNDHLPYSKADIVKVSRIGENTAVSFYQLDYQAMAVKLGVPKASNVDGSEFLIPVGKIVLDTAGFQQLLAEIEQIKIAIAEQK